MTARSHGDNWKRLSSELSQLEDLFRTPDTDKTWSVGTALGEVTCRLNSAVSSFSDVDTPDDSSLTVDEILTDENTERVDDRCRKLREHIMLVIQSLYKLRVINSDCQLSLIHI